MKLTNEQRYWLTYHGTNEDSEPLFTYVESLLAAERAAERERCVAIIDASYVINEAQAVALIAAIRAQGDGK